MKNSLKIHRKSRLLLLTGSVTIVAVLLISTVLYFGAGRGFDYFIATDISEKLLAGVRPLSVAVCVGSLGTEYFLKRKDIDKL